MKRRRGRRGKTLQLKTVVLGAAGVGLAYWLYTPWRLANPNLTLPAGTSPVLPAATTSTNTASPSIPTTTDQNFDAGGGGSSF